VRVSIADDSPFACPRDASVGNIRPAVAVPIIFAASRRVIRFTFPFVMSSGVETSRILNG
jgi:hypothetical protein